MKKVLDETHDPSRRSWVSSANLPDCDFPIQNLPFGIFSRDDGTKRFGIAIGDVILDIGAAREAGLLPDIASLATDAGRDGTLNGLFAQGHGALGPLRRQVANLLDARTPDGAKAQALASTLLHSQALCRMHLPVDVRNYTDFFAGIHHARAAGSLFDPRNPLPANYKHVPIAYHGRASSVRVSGGEVRRPYGQTMHEGETSPRFGPSERLDLELEMGFYVSQGNALGQPIPIGEAEDHVAGLCLLNDWSARDIQVWESRPLGPFLAKNFSTTVSPWVVSTEALAPFRIPVPARPDGDPPPLPYLSHPEDQAAGGLDIALSVSLRTNLMREAGAPAVDIITSNARHLYWTLAQMVAHHSSGGCNLQPGDLIGTGTISGPTRAELSSLLELTMAGAEPLTLPNGERRGFLADGDEVIFSAKCRREGMVSIGFGTCSGIIISGADTVRNEERHASPAH